MGTGGGGVKFTWGVKHRILTPQIFLERNVNQGTWTIQLTNLCPELLKGKVFLGMCFKLDQYFSCNSFLTNYSRVFRILSIVPARNG